MLSCKDASQLISEGQDRKLGLRERIGLRLHLWACDSCRRFEKQISYVRQTLRRGWVHGDLPVHKQLSEEARARIQQVIKQHTDDSNNRSDQDML